MARRFTVIQGGLSEAPDPASGSALTAGQARRGTIVLAWSRDAATARQAGPRVELPATRRPLRDGLAHRLGPYATDAGAAVENAVAEAVDRALQIRLGALHRPARLAGPATPPCHPAPARPRLTAGRSATPRPIPAANLLGIRPAGWDWSASASLAVSEPEASRTLDIRAARRPFVADPAEASPGRLMTRFLAHRGALRVAFLGRAGEIVSGIRHRGFGVRAVPGRRARA